jgi:manganese/zinc/iron transport system substrate-binding protein
MRARHWGLAAALLALALAGGCGGGGGKAEDDGRLNVVATTGQVGDLALRVGGDRVRVTTLMGPGIDPHLYKASAGDLERLLAADLVLSSGLHLEAKMGEVLERMDGGRKSLAVTAAIPESLLLAPPEFSGAHDPHVWFDIPLWLHAVDAVRDALIAKDPANAAGYQERAATYRTELAALDAEVRAAIASIPAERRVLITAHDAFNYFGRAYGLEVRGLQGISTVAEAGTGDVQALAAFIAERRIPALFVESSVSPKAIEAVLAAVRARGFEVAMGGSLYSDALGDTGTPTGSYPGMIRHNVATIVAALGGASKETHAQP